MQTLGQWPVHKRYIGQKEWRPSLSRYRVHRVAITSHMDSQCWENIHVQNGKLRAGLNFILKFLSPVTPEADKLEVVLKQQRTRVPEMRPFYRSSVNISTSSLFQGQTFPSNTPAVLIVSHTCCRKSPVFGAPTFQQPAFSFSNPSLDLFQSFLEKLLLTTVKVTTHCWEIALKSPTPITLPGIFKE